MQNFTTASLNGHRDMEEQILQLQKFINGSRYECGVRDRLRAAWAYRMLFGVSFSADVYVHGGRDALDTPLLAALHEKAMRLYRQYLVL